MNTLIIGTRGSPLALAQVTMIQGLLEQAHPGLVIGRKIIKTSGDKFTEMSLAAGGGKGLFTKEIEDQLLHGEIQLAVHSLKDLPTTLPAGLEISATPAREDVRDVFISPQYASPEELPVGARVATSSIRRRAQLLARRPDLQVEEIRGNVETRLRKLAESNSLAGMLLAAAGLKRLGLWKPGYHLLDANEMIPAVGQGAIGLEVRTADAATRELLAAINDPATFASVTAERAFLRAVGGGCQTPFAAHARIEGDELRLLAAKFSPDGKHVQKTVVRGPRNEPEQLGEAAAKNIQ